MCVLEEIMDYFLIKMDWSYFKHNELLHMSNEYKIPKDKHEVVDFGVIDEIAASEILF